MASQDWISQFSQDIPATQPDRSHSRTPRRQQDAHTQGQVPHFRGPLHYATQLHGGPWQPRGMMPSPHHMPSVQTPQYQPPGHLPFSTTFPPTPPMFPPPPPPTTPHTPQRMYTTMAKSPTTPSPPLMRSLAKTGYQLRAIEIPPVDDWTPDVDYHDTNKVNGLDRPSYDGSEFTIRRSS